MNKLTPDFVDFDNYIPEQEHEADVIPAWAYADTVCEYFAGKLGGKGVTLPWSKTHHDVRLRPGEVTIWTGRNFSGKSQILGQTMIGCIQQGERVCIASMEMKPHTTIARMTRQAAGSREPTDEFTHAFLDWCGDKLWLYQQTGSLTAQRILGVARYCGDGIKHHGKRIKVNHLVIDSMMKCGLKNDDYTAQKDFINEICTIAMDTGMHIHLVVHQNKAGDESQIGDRYSVRGASEITDQPDNCFIIWRNRQKEREKQYPESMQDKEILSKPDAVMRIDKQRHGEFSGDFNLWFHEESMQFVAGEGNRPIEFFEYRKA
jgi:twinkle protein